MTATKTFCDHVTAEETTSEYPPCCDIRCQICYPHEIPKFTKIGDLSIDDAIEYLSPYGQLVYADHHGYESFDDLRNEYLEHEVETYIDSYCDRYR